MPRLLVRVLHAAAFVTGFGILPLLRSVMGAVFVVKMLSMTGGPRGWRKALRQLLRMARTLLTFWRWLRLPPRVRAALGRLEGKPDPAGGGAGALVGAAARLWLRLDPRTAVRFTYRRFLRALEREGLPRPPHLSPRALERALIEAGYAGPEIRRLTTAYDLVRYSHHGPEAG